MPLFYITDTLSFGTSWYDPFKIHQPFYSFICDYLNDLCNRHIHKGVIYFNPWAVNKYDIQTSRDIIMKGINMSCTLLFLDWDFIALVFLTRFSMRQLSLYFQNDTILIFLGIFLVKFWWCKYSLCNRYSWKNIKKKTLIWHLLSTYLYYSSRMLQII